MMPRTSIVPVAGSIPGATYSIVPRCGKPVSSDRPTSTGTLCSSAKRQPALVQIGADLQRLLRADIGDHVDRVELGDFGERGLLAVAADDIARIDQVLAHLAVERRPDLGIAEVQLGQRDLRLRRQHVRLGARSLVVPVIDLDLGGRVLLHQRRVSADLGLGVEQRRLRSCTCACACCSCALYWSCWIVNSRSPFLTSAPSWKWICSR